MSYRQIKSPALTSNSVSFDSIKPGIIFNQTSALSVASMDDDSMLIHVASTNTLSKLTIANLSSSLVTDRLPATIVTQSTELLRTMTDQLNLLRTQTAMVTIMEGMIT